jgi:hypothetical protein
MRTPADARAHLAALARIVASIDAQRAAHPGRAADIAGEIADSIVWGELANLAAETARSQQPPDQGD